MSIRVSNFGKVGVQLSVVDSRMCTFLKSKNYKSTFLLFKMHEYLHLIHVPKQRLNLSFSFIRS